VTIALVAISYWCGLLFAARIVVCLHRPCATLGTQHSPQSAAMQPKNTTEGKMVSCTYLAHTVANQAQMAIPCRAWYLSVPYGARFSPVHCDYGNRAGRCLSCGQRCPCRTSRQLTEPTPLGQAAQWPLADLIEPAAVYRRGQAYAHSLPFA